MIPRNHKEANSHIKAFLCKSWRHMKKEEIREIVGCPTTQFSVIFFFYKKTSLLACRVVCTSQSDCCIRVCISHQSDCRIRVCILHQSYHSIWISCTNQEFGFLLFCKWCHWIRELCIRNDINKKFWAHLISVMICGLWESHID